MVNAEDRNALTETLLRLRPYIERRLASPADADDVIQDVFLRVQSGITKLRQEERFGPWLYRVVRNAIADRHRALAGAAELALPEEILGSPQDEEDPQTGLVACIAPFLSRLPEPYREAVTMVDLEGMTQKEAAQRLRISLPGMKSRVQRGRAMLRDLPLFHGHLRFR